MELNTARNVSIDELMTISNNELPEPKRVIMTRSKVKVLSVYNVQARILERKIRRKN